MDARKIRELHDKAYLHNQETRERAADDLIFYWVTQWGDKFLESSTVQTRMEFNQIRKAGRKIITDIKTNPIQVDFEPVGDTEEDLSDVLDGMYRAAMRGNVSLEAKENACVEAIVCGFGAWEQATEWKFDRKGRKKQVIKRIPIYEANNTAFCDPNARYQDKSDSDYWSILVPYTKDGYINLVKDLTGEDISDDEAVASFAFPEESYTFPWLDSNEVYYVSRFYHRTREMMKTYVYQDVLEDVKEVKETELTDDMLESLEIDGYELVDEYEREHSRVKLYIVGGGDEILDEYEIPGDHIPVVPVYGERAIVEGVEHYEGITRLAKDPQRLRNFIGSYIADIAARTPLRQPIYLPEQIAGFERMYENNGADQIYPYLLQNRKAPDGEALPVGAVGFSEPQDLPPAASQAFELAVSAINDVAGEPLPDQVSDIDLSGEALKELRGKMEAQSYIYQHNLKTALRRDAEIFVSIASDIYDTQETVMLVKFDGSRAKETINQQEIDPMTLQVKVKNNLKDAEFEVYADIGASYSSLREKQRAEAKEMILNSPPDDPMRQIMLLHWHTMNEGVMGKPLRDYARKQLILQGVYEPETEEEQQMIMEAQMAAQNQPNPQMLLAQAEAEARLMEGQAAIQNEVNDANKILIDKQKADNDTAKVQIEAAKAGVDIQKTLTETAGKQIDNRMKLMQRVSRL